jgi:nucleotide-binding universal stress UspA family protein
MGVKMKILVAIDGSKDAGKGVQLALDIAKTQGAEVWLLAVTPVYPGIDLEITARARDSLEGKLSSQAEQTLGKAKGLFQTNGITPKAMLISSGAIADEIVGMAEQEKMDLIVLGSRGLGATGRFSLGGTAMKIISHAPCSVLVARENQ